MYTYQSSSRLKLYPLTCGDRIIPVQQSQYYGCCCPGSLRRQDISTHDINYVGNGLTSKMREAI